MLRVVVMARRVVPGSAPEKRNVSREMGFATLNGVTLNKMAARLQVLYTTNRQGATGFK
jgi:hypothetical protein